MGSIDFKLALSRTHRQLLAQHRHVRGIRNLFSDGKYAFHGNIMP
jgi:hypothetical protein